MDRPERFPKPFGSRVAYGNAAQAGLLPGPRSNRIGQNNDPKTEERIQLGRSGIEISRLGIGTWQWGDRFFWNYGRGGFTDEDLRKSFEACLRLGINFFDTAESYGSGRSEELLGRFAQQAGQPVVVATKFMPFPWRLRRADLSAALRRSLARLGRPVVDLYQIHWPFPPVPVETWAEALGEVVEQGLARAVGVSNYNREQMRRAADKLEEQGGSLASNQVPYSLYNRKVERNGLLRTCQELGITLIAYSPLAQGLLTGKYTPQNRPPGVRRWIYRGAESKIQPLIGLMGEIGQSHRGKTPAQVALNWVICKGAMPIPGAKNLRQAQENLGALGWRLAEEEVAALDAASYTLGQ